MTQTAEAEGPQRAPEPDEPGVALQAIEPSPPSFLQVNRREWAPEQVAVIRQTVAKGATDAQLAMFLELSAFLRLNPLAKEIWCAVKPARNGGEPDVMVMVGRDGMLRKAREWDKSGYGKFLGMQDG